MEMNWCSVKSLHFEAVTLQDGTENVVRVGNWGGQGNAEIHFPGGM